MKNLEIRKIVWGLAVVIALGIILLGGAKRENEFDKEPIATIERNK